MADETEARRVLFAIAGGQDVRLTLDQAAWVYSQLFTLARDNARLIKRIENATKDLQAQADQLVGQVVAEEARAALAERKLQRARVRIRRMNQNAKANQ
jgi:hypothetical protein